MTTTIKIYLRNKPDKNNLYPVSMRVTKNRKSKIIALGIKCTKSQWDEKRLQLKKSFTDHTAYNQVISKMTSKANSIISDFARDEVDFTLNQFDARFRGKKLNEVTISEFWLETISDLNKSVRTGNARASQGTFNSFFKFHKNKSIQFKELSVTMLEKYVVYLKSNNNTDGGIGFKLRGIRALFNEAIKRDLVSAGQYPFNTFKVSKYKSSPAKRALTKEQMKALLSVDADKYPTLLNSKNYMIFSYTTGGTNFIDIMKLKWSNIQGDRIVFKRSKTKVDFSIKITPIVQEILNYYKVQNRATNYVFPILLKEGLTPIQIENRKAKSLKKFNKDLKTIAKLQGVEENVTSYVLRHSAATVLKMSGESIEVISEVFGHSDVSVTNSYLKSFDNQTKDDALKNLL